MTLSKLSPEAQVAYLNLLKSKATAIATTRATSEPDKLLIDLQGRSLIEVSVTEQELEDLHITVETAHELVRKKTSVSLDISTIPAANNLFKEQLKAALNDPEVFADSEALANKVTTLSKGSIIALQQELHFHLSLASRVYLKEVSALHGKEKEMQSAHEDTMGVLNAELMTIYANALKKAYKSDGTIDFEILNTALDKARKQITPLAHKKLREHIRKKAGVELTSKSFNATLKHTAEETTATSNDLVHTDSSLGLITWIEGGDVTAHERHIKGEQDKLATRQIVTLKLSSDGTVSQHAQYSGRMQIRVPALDAKRLKTASEAQHIQDVNNKLTYIATNYFATRKPQPSSFTYNLYTSLHHHTDEVFNENLQTQGARHILLGAHQYNKSNPSLLCFVQNIPINGFGSALGYDKRTIVREATLMTDLALLHSILDKNDERLIELDTLYRKYLDASTFLNNTPPYFNRSPQGKEVINKIEAIKASLKDNSSPPPLLPVELPPAVIINAKKYLTYIVANNLHHDANYSKLTQSLSVFIEGYSIGGCKSANERAQAINGRVYLLDSLLSPKEPLKEEQLKLRAALSANPTDDALKNLKGALNQAYNGLGLQTALSMISLVDQGAAAKGMAKDGFTVNGNYFEDEELTYLHQSKASSMQAHKGLTEYMIAACTEQLSNKIIDPKIQKIQTKLNGQISKYSLGLSRLKEKDFIRLQEMLPEDTLNTIRALTRENYQTAELSEDEIAEIVETVTTKLKELGHNSEQSKPLKNILNAITPDDQFVATLLTQKKAQDSLYKGIDAYKEQHLQKVNKYLKEQGLAEVTGVGSDYFRQKFIEYCLCKNFDSYQIPDTGDDLRKNAPKEATKSLQALFGEKGAELYHLALEEERFSKEYMNAVFYNSTTYYEGEKWTERPVVIVGGPSASGKSFAAQAAVQSANDFLPKHQGNQAGNYVVAADGGIAREVSQIRKLAIRVANKHGFTGISDLHDQSKVLGKVKECVQSAVFQTENLGVVIPETFSKPFTSKSLHKQVSKLKNTKVIFSRVDGADPKTFREVVSFMGSRRAWKTNGFNGALELDLNSVKELCESKGYGKNGFYWGREGSLAAEKYFKDHYPDLLCLLITNDLILLRSNPKKCETTPRKDQWIRASENDKQVIKVSETIYKKWCIEGGNTTLIDFMNTNSATLIATTAEQGIKQAEQSIRTVLDKPEMDTNPTAKNLLRKALQAVENRAELNNPTNINSALERVEKLQRDSRRLGNVPSYANKALNELHTQLELRFQEVALVAAIKQYRTTEDINAEQANKWHRIKEEQTEILANFFTYRALKAPLLSSFSKLDAMSIPKLNEAFLPLNAKATNELVKPLKEMSKECTALIQSYEEQTAKINQLLKNLPSSELNRGTTYQSEVEAHRKQLTDTLEEINKALDKVLYPAKKRIDGDKDKESAIERNGLLRSIASAQKTDKETQLDSVFHLTHRDIEINSDPDLAFERDEAQEDEAAVAIDSSKSVYKEVEKLTTKKQRVYQVTAAEEPLGTFVEQHIEAPKTTTSPNPQTKFIATKPPKDDLGKKVVYNFALASQLLGTLATPPTKESPLIIEGSSKVDMQFLYTALLILGKKMNFGPEAIHVRSLNFDPSKELGTLSLFSRNSCYEMHFKNHPSKKEILEDFTTLLKDRNVQHKQQDKLENDLSHITEKFKKRLKSIPDSPSSGADEPNVNRMTI